MGTKIGISNVLELKRNFSVRLQKFDNFPSRGSLHSNPALVSVNRPSEMIMILTRNFQTHDAKIHAM